MSLTEGGQREPMNLVLRQSVTFRAIVETSLGKWRYSTPCCDSLPRRRNKKNKYFLPLVGIELITVAFTVAWKLAPVPRWPELLLVSTKLLKVIVTKYWGHHGAVRQRLTVHVVIVGSILDVINLYLTFKSLRQNVAFHSGIQHGNVSNSTGK